MIICFSYSSSCFISEPSGSNDSQKIFSGFLPAGHKKKIRSIRAILGVASVSLRRRARVQALMNYSETQITQMTRIYVL